MAKYLNHEGVSYEVSDDKCDTLLAHGILRHMEDGGDDEYYRLATAEEMIDDPGSPFHEDRTPVSRAESGFVVFSAFLSLGDADDE